MRDEFMKRINARDNNTNNTDNEENRFDIAAQPFGAEEMLLKAELDRIDGKKSDYMK